MSAHREPGDSERAESVALAPVEQHQRLQDQAAAHHEYVRHVV